MYPYACLPIFQSPYTPITPFKERFQGHGPEREVGPRSCGQLAASGRRHVFFAFLFCTALRPHAGTIYGLEGPMLVICIDLEPQGIRVVLSYAVMRCIVLQTVLCATCIIDDLSYRVVMVFYFFIRTVPHKPDLELW